MSDAPYTFNNLRHFVNDASWRLDGRALNESDFQAALPAGNAPRFYHGIDHVWDMAGLTSDEYAALVSAVGEKLAPKTAALMTLGGFYHDCIYTQVDGGVTPAAAA